MARETGVQYMFQQDSLPMHFSLVFLMQMLINLPTVRITFCLYLTTGYKIINHKNILLSMGGSAAYRHLNKTTLTTIYKPDTLLPVKIFAGDLKPSCNCLNLELQGEYVQHR
jgi:hypothetical protein